MLCISTGVECFWKYIVYAKRVVVEGHQCVKERGLSVEFSTAETRRCDRLIVWGSHHLIIRCVSFPLK